MAFLGYQCSIEKSASQVVLHQASQVADRTKVIAVASVVGFELQLVLLTQRDAQFKRVDRVEPEAVVAETAARRRRYRRGWCLQDQAIR